MVDRSGFFPFRMGFSVRQITNPNTGCTAQVRVCSDQLVSLQKPEAMLAVSAASQVKVALAHLSTMDRQGECGRLPLPRTLSTVLATARPAITGLPTPLTPTHPIHHGPSRQAPGLQAHQPLDDGQGHLPCRLLRHLRCRSRHGNVAALPLPEPRRVREQGGALHRAAPHVGAARGPRVVVAAVPLPHGEPPAQPDQPVAPVRRPVRQGGEPERQEIGARDYDCCGEGTCDASKPPQHDFWWFMLRIWCD
ncbi:hypothetical protein ON010_g11730 [Phytophthora cinnamomi]|nr:hypothetical protein ON010_g11730 [Phytophthora cinnamomi]